MTEIERPFLAAKGFNTNLIQYLQPYHVVIMCTISHVHGCAPKTVLHAQNLVHKKL